MVVAISCDMLFVLTKGCVLQSNLSYFRYLIWLLAFACMALVHLLLPQPAQEKAQPCGYWTERQGQQRNTGSFYTSQPVPVLA